MKASNPTTVLSLQSPKVREALTDFTTMQRWEVLRTSGSALSAAELAAACFTSFDEMQKSLDLLVESGFAVRVKATAKRRSVTYRAASQDFLVSWDRSDPVQLDWVRGTRARSREHTYGVLVRNSGGGRSGIPNRIFRELHRSAPLSKQEAAEILKSLDQITAVLDEAERRRRAASGGESAMPAGGADSSDPPTPYYVTASLLPIAATELPIPVVNISEIGLVAETIERKAKSPKSILSKREFAIAELLAAGRSRVEAARALELSTSTVASATKRIYAKLGVHNRAAFSLRMREA